MRLLFCNIAWMNYYKGIIPEKDEPYGGGSYVVEHKEGGEVFNFDPLPIQLDDGTVLDICYGFTETKTSKSGKMQELHIEKIEGCEDCGKQDFVEDVTVIYCAAKPNQRFTSVVGWYKHATVYRKYQEPILIRPDGTKIYLCFNAEALKENCVLLPREERRPTLWNVPRRQTGASYGFGQSNVWFADGRRENKLLDEFLKKMIDKIENYQGENWIDYIPDTLK